MPVSRCSRGRRRPPCRNPRNGSPPSVAAARARWCPTACCTARQGHRHPHLPDGPLDLGQARAAGARPSRHGQSPNDDGGAPDGQRGVAGDRGPPDGAGDRQRDATRTTEVRRRRGRGPRGDRRVARHARRPVRRVGGPVPPAAPGRARLAGWGDGRRGDHRGGDAGRGEGSSPPRRRPFAKAPTSSWTRPRTSARPRRSTGWRGPRSASGSWSLRWRPARSASLSGVVSASDGCAGGEPAGPMTTSRMRSREARRLRCRPAGVAEQVDAADLKSAARKGVRVRISAPAPESHMSSGHGQSPCRRRPVLAITVATRRRKDGPVLEDEPRARGPQPDTNPEGMGRSRMPKPPAEPPTAAVPPSAEDALSTLPPTRDDLMGQAKGRGDDGLFTLVRGGATRFVSAPMPSRSPRLMMRGTTWSSAFWSPHWRQSAPPASSQARRMSA